MTGIFKTRGKHGKRATRRRRNVKEIAGLNNATRWKRKQTGGQVPKRHFFHGGLA
ncbi:hypothetical protein WN48_08516 [Eufriesea mexicana]|uniref:Uncharacterized protein n=1 Tax=Eufriesea mexicana TaxID=516756 RepID=A0A310SSB4_9HYME|nr:hypothetical protein WN48_08516 [Eufriesea mexicana]